MIGVGATFVGSNPAYKTIELRRLFKSSKPKCLIVDPGELGTIRQVAADCGVSDSNIFILDTDEQDSALAPESQSWRKLLHDEVYVWYRFNDQHISKNTAACLLSTSGTSGLPKMASMSHYALVAQAVLAAQLDGQLPHKVRTCLCLQAFSLADSFQVRRLISLPFWHSFVLPYHLTALRLGQPTYVVSRFRAREFASSIDKYQITNIPIVPPIAKDLFSSPFSDAYSYTSLREVTCAGAPLSWDLQRKFVRALPESARFCQLWGMSELGWITAFAYPETDDTGSVGRLLSNTKAK